MLNGVWETGGEKEQKWERYVKIYGFTIMSKEEKK